MDRPGQGGGVVPKIPKFVRTSFMDDPKQLLYYAINSIALITCELVSFEKVFHRTKFLAFAEQIN